MWSPQKRTLICCAHFIGNKRSHDPKSPSYVPSIFPSIYKKKVSNQDQQNLRYKRSRKRQSLEFNSNSTVPTNACQNVVKDNDLFIMWS